MEVIDLKSRKKTSQSKTANSKANKTPEINFMDRASILAEALPYIQKFSGEVFVIKIGGSAMGDPKVIEEFAKDVTLLKQIGVNPIIVHGGGTQIGEMLNKLKIKSEFIDGLRVTDRQTVDIVEMVLSGSINKEIVTAINKQGGQAVGISGKDANLIIAQKLQKTRRDSDSNIEKILDLGFVGEPVTINPEILYTLDESELIPVIAPIGISKDGQTYNINADTVAGKIASSLNAYKLIVLSDVDGIYNGDKLVNSINIAEINSLIKKKVISAGMIPKTRTCIEALENGVNSAHILNGTTPHILLVEVFTEHGVGTMINIEGNTPSK
ncbi:MAG: acetylglutamate kinase [Rickettsiales bacterium]|jgi:acetylglutamate kinase|nr:acetylglutamate kinase [Rickettsiales bacterium]